MTQYPKERPTTGCMGSSAREESHSKQRKDRRRKDPVLGRRLAGTLPALGLGFSLGVLPGPQLSPLTLSQIWTSTVLFHCCVPVPCVPGADLDFTLDLGGPLEAPWGCHLAWPPSSERSIRTGRCLLGWTPRDLLAVVLGSHSGWPSPHCPLQPSEGSGQDLTIPEACLATSTPPRWA